MDVLKRIGKHLPAAVYKFNDAVAVKAEGCWVYTTGGRRMLDMTSGIGVTSTGHCHPKVVEAVQLQAGRIVHAQQNIFHAHMPMAELVDRLVGVVMPPHLQQFFFCNSGSEAVDNAVKVARAATGRPNIIAFDGGFHGRTIGAMSITTSKTIYRQGFQPLMAGTFTAPYPYCLHCKVQQASSYQGYPLQPDCQPFMEPSARTCCMAPVEQLGWMLKQHTAPEETAAIILEPVLGEGGFLTPPPGMMAALRKLCDEHGILLIADEVQAGVARTGKWWGHQHWPEMQPDVLIFAKGIASGYPMAGLAARQGLFDRLAPGTMGGTYGGNAVACAAAVATIDVIREEGILQNAADRGAELMAGLVELARSHPEIVDVRGRGLMIGVEFGGAAGRGSSPRKGLASEVVKVAAQRHDMLLMPSGARECIRILPPLVLTKEEAALALDKLAKVLEEVLQRQDAS